MKQTEYNKFLEKIRCSDSLCKIIEEKLSADISEQHEYADSVNDVENASGGHIKRIMLSVAACTAVCVVAGTVYHSLKNAPIENEVESSENLYANLPFGDITAMSVRLKYGTFDEKLGEDKVAQIAEYLSTLNWEPTDCADAPEATDSIYLYLTDEIESSQIQIDNTGRVTYYSAPDGVDCAYYYDFTDEVFSRIQGIILTGSIVGEIQYPSGPAAEFIESHFTISDENPVAVYYPDSGQISLSVTFNLTGAETVKEMLLGIDWEIVSDSEYGFEYSDFYVIGNLLINEKGDMMASDGGTIYRVKGNVGEKIAVILKNELQNDELAYIEYLLSKAEDTYDTMSADIKAEYTVERKIYDGKSVRYKLNTKGKVYRSNSGNTYYIDVDGEADTDLHEKVKAEYIYVNGQLVYVEHGENIDSLDNSREFINNNGILTSYDYYEAVDIMGTQEPDYYHLNKEAHGIIEELRYSCEDDISEHYVISNENGVLHYYVSSESLYSSHLPEWTLQLEVDENGNIIKYKKTKNGEVVCNYELSNVQFDSDDFEMPELTVEQQSYFRNISE